MTITQLQYVLAVAEYKNFTLAAEKCFVTQPTLSMQIKKAEDSLGYKIFDLIKFTSKFLFNITLFCQQSLMNF